MRFKVTGGADGVSGIEVANKRYEPGAEVDMTAKQAEWLVEQGYLEPADAAAKRALAEVVVEQPAVTVVDEAQGSSDSTAVDEGDN